MEQICLFNSVSLCTCLFKVCMRSSVLLLIYNLVPLDLWNRTTKKNKQTNTQKNPQTKKDRSVHESLRAVASSFGAQAQWVTCEQPEYSEARWPLRGPGDQWIPWRFTASQLDWWIATNPAWGSEATHWLMGDWAHVIEDYWNLFTFIFYKTYSNVLPVICDMLAAHIPVWYFLSHIWR